MILGPLKGRPPPDLRTPCPVQGRQEVSEGSKLPKKVLNGLPQKGIPDAPKAAVAPANFPRWWPGNHTATTPTCICFIQSEADLLHQSLWHILLVSSGCLSTWMGLATSVRVQTHSLLSTLFHDVLFPPNLPQIMPPPGHHTACPLRHCVPLCRLSHIALCSCGPPLKQPLPVILSLTGLRSWYPGLGACCCVDSGHLRVLNNPFPVASALLQGEMESCLFPFKKQSPSFSSQHHMHGIGSWNWKWEPWTEPAKPASW